MVRAGFLHAQQAWIMAEWAAKNGSKRVVTLVNDWAPGIEAETAFKTRFVQAGGEIVESIRIPLANPDFAPFLQRIRDINPDTAFIYFPGPQAGHLRQAIRRARPRPSPASRSSGQATSPTTTISNNMGDQMLGIITAGPYSASHEFAAQQGLRRGDREGGRLSSGLRFARRL